MELLQKQYSNIWIICRFVLSLKVKVRDSLMTIVNIALKFAKILQELITHTESTGVVRGSSFSTQQPYVLGDCCRGVQRLLGTLGPRPGSEARDQHRGQWWPELVAHMRLAAGNQQQVSGWWQRPIANTHTVVGSRPSSEG